MPNYLTINCNYVVFSFGLSLVRTHFAFPEVILYVERGEYVEHGEAVTEGPEAKVVVEESEVGVDQVDHELQDLELG